MFVGTVQSRTALTVYFFAKKKSNLQFKFDQNIYIYIYNSNLTTSTRAQGVGTEDFYLSELYKYVYKHKS